MSRKFIVISIAVLMLIIALIIIMIGNKQELATIESSNHVEKDIEDTENSNHQEKIAASQQGLTQGLDKFVDEISREICKTEQRALWELTGPSEKQLTPGDEIPIDYDFGQKLSVTQAIEWLNRTATSKCSSFKKMNAKKFSMKPRLIKIIIG